MLSVAIGTSRRQRGSGALARDTSIHWRRQGEAALGNGRTFCERRTHSSNQLSISQSVSQPARNGRSHGRYRKLGLFLYCGRGGIARARVVQRGAMQRSLLCSRRLLLLRGTPVSPARRRLRVLSRAGADQAKPSQAKRVLDGGAGGGGKWEQHRDGLLTSDPHKGSALSGAADHDGWHGTRTELTETTKNSNSKKYGYTLDGCFVVCGYVACCVCDGEGWANKAEKEGVTNAQPKS